MTFFHPKDFVEDFDPQPDIPLLLLECSIFSKKTNREKNLKPEFLKNKSIVIHLGDQSLNLEFALLDYINPKLVIYEY